MTTGHSNSDRTVVIDWLIAHRGEIASVLPIDLGSARHVVFDFTEANEALAGLDLNDAAGFSDLVFRAIEEADAVVGIGRYDEDRVVYRHSPLFDSTSERRSVHLGIDLFVPDGTEVLAPLPATVHSVADNAAVGDYGPTVILEHRVDGTAFHTLYGHLGRSTLDDLERGLELAAGQPFGRIGSLLENGGWPPHLHFQIILDLRGHRGDYPGVAGPTERRQWLALCPDPNLLLRLPGL
jgi:murein DD-endopeptidase MepM/ murein hydrolase activator NlpD